MTKKPSPPKNKYFVTLRKSNDAKDCFDLIHAEDLPEAESIAEKKYPNLYAVVSLILVDQKSRAFKSNAFSRLTSTTEDATR